MSDFLKKLKEAADNGEFNSDAAKKINKINELADSKIGKGTPEDFKRLQEKLNDEVVEANEKSEFSLSEEEVVEINDAATKRMNEMHKLDAINHQLATLIHIEDEVKLSIAEMLGFVEELDKKFEKEFENEEPLFGDLHQKIEEVKSKYKF